MNRPKPSYSGSDPYVFVSYAHADSEIVFPEIAALQENFQVWYDEGINAGLSWRDEIALAITECSAFIIFLTPNSVQSEVCRQELFFALSRERKILVVYLQDCQLTPGMELGISDKQAIKKPLLDAKEYEDKLNAALQVFMFDDYSPQAAASTEAALQDRKGIAVLSLVVIGDSTDANYLAGGIAEELLTGLAQIQDLRVVSGFHLEASQVDIRNMGLKLKVDSVLGGSIQPAGSRVRINMRLTSTPGSQTLWSQRYEFDMMDIFAVQDQVAEDVIKALNLKTETPPANLNFGTSSVAAYEQFLRGLFQMHKDSLAGYEAAAANFRQAVSIDQCFGRAFYYLGLCYWELTVFRGREQQLIDTAESAFESARSLEYAAEIPWLQIKRKLHPELRPGQRELAEEALEIIKDKSDSWQHYELAQLGRCLGAAGLYQASFDFLTSYLEQVPKALKEIEDVRNEAYGLLPILGRFNEAIQHLEDGLGQVPEDQNLRLQRCMLFSRTGQYKRVEQELSHLEVTTFRQFAEFYDQYWQGNQSKAEALIKPLLKTDELQLRFKFRACALLGRNTEAIRFMSESAARGAPLFHIRMLLGNAITQSQLTNLEATPEFIAFLAEHGISAEWPAELSNLVNDFVDYTRIRI